MSATPITTMGWGPEGTNTQLPAGSLVPMQASAQGGQGQPLFFDASGNAALNDGASPGLVCAGVVFPAKLTDTSSTAAAAKAMVHEGMGGGVQASTASSDGFTAADVLAVAWDAGNGTPGKKSNLSGSNRSIMGLVLGLLSDGTPRTWVGRVAHTVARALMIADAYPLASTEIADAAASTAIAEKAIRRPKIHGKVTSIELTGAAIAADNTDYITVTVAKRDGAGGGAVTLGTYDSRAANQGAVTAFTPAAFSLSAVAAALYLLETDIVTITTVKGGSGKVITGQVLVNGKAI
jgi:hypothetical protein